MPENTGWTLGEAPEDPFANIPGAYDVDDVPVRVPVKLPAQVDAATLDELDGARFEAEKRWVACSHLDGDAMLRAARDMVAIYERAAQLARPTSLLGFAARDSLAHWQAVVAGLGDVRRAA